MSRAKNHFFLESCQHQISDRFLFACHELLMIAHTLGDMVSDCLTCGRIYRLWNSDEISRIR